MSIKKQLITRIITTALLLAVFTPVAIAQELKQTIRGTILDADNRLPLVGAQILIPGTDPLVGTVTNLDGEFRLENVPVGRITLVLQYLGYEKKTIPNLVINSGKELILELDMRESVVKMSEVVITASENKGEAINEMSLLSARSVSAEETSRYAGGMNDPSRVVSGFAGVATGGDGGNEIIVRGNSPKYVQWRLEGVQISNPNHFGDQNSAGGSISALNNNLLATSDFYTSAFSPEYGDVLSGVYDIRLRPGNNERFEATFGFGLLGTDITLEGPFKKGYGGSYLVNYRYSTASIVSDLGLIDVGGIPNFQDAAFKVVLPTKKAGIFSVFGLAGLSDFVFEDVTPATWDTPGDGSMRADISEDFKKKSYLLNSGINHTIGISDNSYLKTTISYSTDGIQDNIFESKSIDLFDINGVFLRDSVTSRTLNFDSKLQKTTYRGAMTLNTKLSAKSKIQIGTKYSLFAFDYNQSLLQGDVPTRFTVANFNETIGTVRNFVSWKYRVNEDVTIVSGVHNMNVLLNKKSTIEPRLAVNWKLNGTNSVHAGYGNHSNMESVHNYFAKVQQPDGSVIEPNHDLGLLRAHHFVLGYKKQFNENLTATVEVYYQDLYNLPVENNDTSYYATINEGIDFKYVDLVNEGTGKNYGAEVTLERFFDGYYYTLNGSLYSSTYESLDGVTRNTRYNGNYLVNLLAGKEFDKLGKKENQTLGLNAKLFFGGGKRVMSLLRDDQGELDVDPTTNTYWDYSNAYENKIEDIYQITFSASYKWNKPKATHELFMNLDNLTNVRGKLSEYYDESEPNSIGHVTQFGFFPNLMYRVYF
jgi:hypothetical protein